MGAELFRAGVGMDRRKDTHDESNNRFSQICERT